MLTCFDFSVFCSKKYKKWVPWGDSFQGRIYDRRGGRRLTCYVMSCEGASPKPMLCNGRKMIQNVFRRERDEDISTNTWSGVKTSTLCPWLQLHGRKLSPCIKKKSSSNITTATSILSWKLIDGTARQDCQTSDIPQLVIRIVILRSTKLDALYLIPSPLSPVVFSYHLSGGACSSCNPMIAILFSSLGCCWDQGILLPPSSHFIRFLFSHLAVSLASELVPLTSLSLLINEPTNIDKTPWCSWHYTSQLSCFNYFGNLNVRYWKVSVICCVTIIKPNKWLHFILFVPSSLPSFKFSASFLLPCE